MFRPPQHVQPYPAVTKMMMTNSHPVAINTMTTTGAQDADVVSPRYVFYVFICSTNIYLRVDPDGV